MFLDLKYTAWNEYPKRVWETDSEHRELIQIRSPTEVRSICLDLEWALSQSHFKAVSLGKESTES
jgi:hypothetical protein